MLGRIYPHTVLLIIANIILRASCKGSLTFLIDDTSSMGDDIKQVRSSVNRISDVVFNEKSSLISNMVLVTFNDPDAEVRVVTKNRNTFKRKLDAVYAHNVNNPDCWEPSMKGLLLALDTSNSDSYIYTFTDAPAKDYQDGRYVIEMCQKKQSPVVFVLTGRCDDYHDAQAFKVYFDIAHACSGLAFDVSKTDVKEVLRTIEETIKGNKTVITSSIVPARVKKDIKFTIDDRTEYAIVSVSGKNVYLEIKGPSTNLEKIMWNNNGKVVKLSKTRPGTYVATVMGQTKTSVLIVGRTDFFFTHGFSELKPKALGDTSLQPIADANVYLSISVTDDHHSVKIVSAQIIDMNESPMKSPLPLTEISKDFYVTDPFVAPSQRFRIALNGMIKATGKTIKRIVKIPIAPAEPPKILPTNTKPTVEIAEGKAIEIEYNSMVKLTCKVVAFPEPKINWINNNGGLMPSKMSLQEYPYKYISYMDISYASKGDRYKCYVVNDVGRNETTIDVVVKEPFTVNSASSGITKFTYGAEGTITCDVTSRLPMDIHWRYANEMTGKTREIETSDKYEVSASRTKLKIKKMDLDLVGRYTCKVFLKNKKDVEKSFNTRVKIDGLVAPKVQGGIKIKVTKGNTAIFECKVISGLPAPKITWLFGGKSGSTFTSLAGSDSVLRITNVEDKHEGRYKCVAENGAGKDEHVTRLFVQDIPKITTKSSILYQATEGDVFLRIPCAVAGFPKPAIVWKLSGRYITPSAKYSIEDGTLIIRDPKLSDTNSYTCEAKNEVGAVRATFKTYIRQAPQVSGVTEKKVRIGTPADVECTVEGEPKPTITWQFMDNSGSKFLPISGSGKVLNFPRVENKHAGRYKCVANNEVGSNEHITTLEVQDIPKIVSSVSTIYQSTEGDASLRIPCVTGGLPKPSITWKFNGLVIYPSAKYFMEDETLIIRDPKLSDTNSYTCEAKNEVGTVSATFRTYVHQLPKLGGVASKNIRLGTPANIECMIVKGEPKPRITWQFMGKSASKYVAIAGSENSLHIVSAKMTHAGNYKCVAQNDIGSDEHVTTLIVIFSPTVEIAEGKAIEIEYNSMVKLTCKVVAFPEPKIEWLNNNGILMPSKMSLQEYPYKYTSYMDISYASKGDRYKCYAVNDAGRNETTIDVVVKDPFTVKSVSSGMTKFTYGTEGTITCDITSRLPMEIHWHYTNEMTGLTTEIAPSDKYEVSANRTQLNIKSMDLDLVGRYTCKVSLKNKKDVEKSFSTIVKIDGLIAPKVQGGIEIKVTKGETAIFECKVVRGLPAPKITWQFGGKSGSTFTPLAGSKSMMRITNVEDKHEGKYKCVADNGAGKDEHVTTLFVQDLPKITAKSSIVYQATDGDALLRIPCEAAGVPKPAIVWKLSGRDITPSAKYSIEDGTLIIRNPKVSDTNSYTCEAKNEAGVVSATFNTYIRQAPQVSGVTVKKARIETPDGIECTVEGEPKPTITWQFMDNSGSTFLQIPGSGKVINFPRVENKHAGRYKCVANNEVGSNEHITTLEVQDMPKIVSSVSTIYQSTEGDASLRIPCVAGSLPKSSITWKLNGLVINPSAKYFIEDGTLIIKDPKVSDTNSYTCEAKNEVGAVSATFRTYIRQLPKLEGVTSKNVRLGTPASIECMIVKGEPRPRITWQFMGKSASKYVAIAGSENTLRIVSAKMTHAGNYKCVAQNDIGSDEHVATLIVEFSPTVEIAEGKAIEIEYNSMVKLTCKVVAFPEPKIEWLNNNGILMPSKMSLQEYPYKYTSYMDISYASKGDRYKCYAVNDVGRNETTIDVVVKDPFTVKSDSSGMTKFTYGTEGTITCDITSRLPMEIHWHYTNEMTGLTTEIAPSDKYEVSENRTQLNIKNMDLDLVGRYTCKVSLKNKKDVEKSFSTIVKIDGLIAPKVQGEIEIKVTKGETTIFECKVVSGLPTPKITWLFGGKSGSTFTPLAGSKSMMRITNVEDKHEGKYKCVADNGAGKDEHVTTLFVQDLPKITAKSSVVYQATDGDALLRIPCEAAGVPKPAIVWKLSGRDITPSAKYSIEDGTLIIRNPKVSDTNSYTCEAKNEAGVVSATFKTYIRQAPQVSGVTVKKARIETPDGIECTVEGEPKPTITWQFMDNFGSTFLQIPGTEKVLNFPRVENKHAGRYKCVANNEVGSNEHITTLEVQDMPKIVSSVSTIYQSTEGDASLRIPCVAGSLPKSSITWKFNGLVINPSAKYFIEDGTLIIKDPKVSDTNSYTCEAKNEVGAVSATFRTYIRQLPKLEGVTTKNVRLDTPASIECMIVKGEPRPRITWQFMGKSASKYVAIAGSENTLRIVSVKMTHAGNYKCVAQNDIGSDEHVTTLIVEFSPTVEIAEGKAIEIEYNSMVKLTCKVVAFPEPKIEWLNNNGILMPSKMSLQEYPYKYTSYMDISYASKGDRYKCYAVNDVGRNETTIDVVVKDPFTVKSDSSGMTKFTYGTEGTITCDVTSRLPMEIHWHYTNEMTGLTTEIAPSDKYEVSANRTQLNIKNMDLDLVGRYTCKVSLKNKKDVEKSFSTLVKIDGLIAPKVQGGIEIKVTKGETAIFECKVVSGLPAPKITWLFGGKSGSTFTPLAGSKSMMRITNVEDKHEGKYKCVADNGAGKDEHVTTLFVQDLPKITAKSSIVYQATDGDALLRIPCEAAGVPKPAIVWKLSGRDITPSAKYSIEDGTLIIRNPKVSDTNSYTCEAKNEVGAVSATFNTYIRQAPQVSGVTVKKARIETPDGIECTVKGEPKPTITWQFMDNFGSTFLQIPGTEKVLNFPRVENKHAGRYKCVANNEVGTNEHITTLEVQDMPKIQSSVSNLYQSTEGDASLRIPCVASGLPKPRITWKLNGLVIYPSAKYSIEDGTLIIRNPNVSDTNSYTCEAKNEGGVVSATFKPYIRQAPQVSGVTAKKVRLGMPANIECTVEGEPKPTITWQFMDDSGSKILQFPGSDKVLNFPRVESKHAGRYKCVAKNEVGSNEHITALEVQEMPKIVSSVSTIYRSTEGDASVRIPCVASGLPKPRITWKLNGLVIYPTAKYSIEDGTLVIRDPKVSDTNSYTCEARNEVRTVSATLRTYIRQLPKLSGVASKNVRLGTPASIECMVVKGEPKPRITWQYMDKSALKYVPIAGSENTLRISRAKETHAGSYKCVAQNDIGSDEHVTTLVVEFAPEIKKISTIVEGIEEDLALRIPCDVVGIPKPIITWKLRGATITPDSKYTIEDGALLIMKLAEKDSSIYSCEAKNYISTVSTTFHATVKKLPTNFGTEHFVYLMQGETKKLKCDAYSSTSQAVKWFITKDAGIKEPYMQIENALFTDHDGNYTCRVSDKHGNTHTHTYVVDVGSAPEFLSDANSLNYWRGDISHIIENCDILENAKPKPVVEWRLNGQVLTDLNSAGLGHYTCNVSNVHGSVQRRFDVKSSACLITRNLGIRHMQYMPLVLDDKGFWHKLDNTNHYTVVEQEDKITLSCPSQKEASNTFKNFPKKSTLVALCDKEDSFVVEDKIYKLSDLQCTNRIQPSVIRMKVKCFTETSELIRVGYNVPGFLEAYEVCFDTEKNMPLYTRIIMTETNNNGLSAGYNWFTYPGIGNKKTERGFTCKDTMSSCCYSKSQLVNAIDFNDGPAKKSSFIDPLNVIPVWLPCNTSKPSWENINDMVRSQLPTYTEIITWSGTHTLQEKSGAIIPRYLWKVVRLDDDEAVAIVHVNDPKPIEKDIKCKTQDICDKYEDWFISSDKYTYCCSLPDFFKSFDIHDTEIGEPMDAVLDKIEKSTCLQEFMAAVRDKIENSK